MNATKRAGRSRTAPSLAGPEICTLSMSLCKGRVRACLRSAPVPDPEGSSVVDPSAIHNGMARPSRHQPDTAPLGRKVEAAGIEPAEESRRHPAQGYSTPWAAAAAAVSR